MLSWQLYHMSSGIRLSDIKSSVVDFGQIVYFFYIKMIIVNVSQLVGRSKGSVLLKAHSIKASLVDAQLRQKL